MAADVAADCYDMFFGLGGLAQWSRSQRYAVFVRAKQNGARDHVLCVTCWRTNVVTGLLEATGYQEMSEHGTEIDTPAAKSLRNMHPSSKPATRDVQVSGLVSGPAFEEVRTSKLNSDSTAFAWARISVNDPGPANFINACFEPAACNDPPFLKFQNICGTPEAQGLPAKVANLQIMMRLAESCIIPC